MLRAKARQLTAVAVRTLGPGRHGDGRGMFLIVKPSGGRSWVLRVQAGGRRRDIGLGSADIVTLAEARELAAQLRKVAKAGRDPVLERDKDKQAVPTFAQAMEAAYDALSPGWTAKSQQAFKASLALHAMPKLGKLRVDSVTPAHVRDALAKVWVEKPETGRKVKVRIGQVMDFAKAKGWRSDGAPTAREISMGLSRQPRPGHFEALPYARVQPLVNSLGVMVPTAGRLALLFTVLTAARSGEVRAMRWEQIDRAKGIWERPESIMKTRQSHTITLSTEAMSALGRAATALHGVEDDQWPRSGLVFPGTGGRTLSDMTLTKALRSLGEEYDGVTVHGFRSTFRDWAAECMPAIPSQAVEASLAHTVGSKVERAYLRTDFLAYRRQLLEAWGEYCTGHTDGKTVIPLHGRAVA